jgi:hypothetical protein
MKKFTTLAAAVVCCLMTGNIAYAGTAMDGLKTMSGNPEEIAAPADIPAAKAMSSGGDGYLQDVQDAVKILVKYRKDDNYGYATNVINDIIFDLDNGIKPNQVNPSSPEARLEKMFNEGIAPAIEDLENRIYVGRGFTRDGKPYGTIFLGYKAGNSLGELFPGKEVSAVVKSKPGAEEYDGISADEIAKYAEKYKDAKSSYTLGKDGAVRKISNKTDNPEYGNTNITTFFSIRKYDKYLVFQHRTKRVFDASIGAPPTTTDHYSYFFKDVKAAAAENKEVIAPSRGVQHQETDTQNLKQVKADLTRLLTLNLPDNVVRVESLKVSRAPNGDKYHFEAKTIETGLVLSKRYTIKGIYDPNSTKKVELLEKTFEGAVN